MKEMKIADLVLLSLFMINNETSNTGLTPQHLLKPVCLCEPSYPTSISIFIKEYLTQGTRQGISVLWTHFRI